MNDLIFNSTRLKFARKLRGLTAQALCDRLCITTRTLSDFENGRAEPQSITLHKFVSILEFPEEFFFADDISPLDDSAVSFRSLSRMAAKVRDAVLHEGQLALDLSEWLDKRFDTPSVAVPDLRHLTPAAAAETLRSMWALGENPIGNMVHLIESKGIRVFSLTADSTDMDACSFWKADRPFIFLNTQKSVEHSRFDAAHELGHLVLHKHGGIGKAAEIQAHEFAATFLMTESSVRAYFRMPTTLDKIIADKCLWKVAAFAYTRRLKELSLITEWQYRSFCVGLSKRGYRKKEPNPILQRETSKLLPMLFQALRQEGVTKQNIAKDMKIYSKDIDSLIFNLTLLPLPGGSMNRAAPGSPKKPGNLRLIK
ncbi:MAG: XRE family transcriptional regulator [Syntrophales bacterium]|jgi:Zn-dependent peptidase ImmA (M78 family)/DNA-binding XRE family transcriptional regulator|nr:XRE family transcriptional regulator [Syntrophales bacterium]